MLPALSDNGNHWAVGAMIALCVVSIVLAVPDLWPASVLSAALVGWFPHHARSATALVLILASFAVGYAVGYTHDMIAELIDVGKGRRRKRDRS
jgi:hypothetical protein